MEDINSNNFVEEQSDTALSASAATDAAAAHATAAAPFQQFSDVDDEITDHLTPARAHSIASQQQNILIDSSDDGESAGSQEMSGDRDSEEIESDQTQSDRNSDGCDDSAEEEEEHDLNELIVNGELESLKRWYERQNQNGAVFPSDALHKAAAMGYLAICKWFVEECKIQVDACVDNETPLLVAADNGRTQVCVYLLQQGADVNLVVDGDTPLVRAVESNFADVVRVLIEHGAMVNYRETSKGKSPLHVAVENSNATICRILLEAGADTHIADAKEFTPLFFVATKEVYQLLMQYGANVNQQCGYHADRFLIFPCGFAVGQERTDILQQMIDDGAHIDPRSIPHIAAEDDHLESLLVLYEAGIDMAVRSAMPDDEPRIPLDEAVLFEQDDAALLLFSFGADSSTWS